MEDLINLHKEADSFFDLLKAVIRQWQASPWQHERERAGFAVLLFERCLQVCTGYLEEAKAKAESGYNLEVDQRLVKEMESKLLYWQRKLEELTSQDKVAASC